MRALSEHYSTYHNEKSPEDESSHSDPVADPFETDHANESIDNIGNEMAYIRQLNESEARLNIKVEQMRQKRIYDKKVKTNR